MLPELRLGLARNPSLPPSLVDVLLALNDGPVLLEPAGRDDLGNDRIELLARGGDSQVVVRLVERGLLRVDQLDGSDPHVVIAVADFGPIPQGWAWRVAAHTDPAVRARLAPARYLPADVVAALAVDPDPEVVAEAALSPQITPGLAGRLATHRHVSVRRALACNERAPSEVLAALAERRPPGAQLCPVCDGSGHWLAEQWTCDGGHQSAMDDVDYALVLNPAVPLDVLAALAASTKSAPRCCRASLPPASPRSKNWQARRSRQCGCSWPSGMISRAGSSSDSPVTPTPRCSNPLPQTRI